MVRAMALLAIPLHALTGHRPVLWSLSAAALAGLALMLVQAPLLPLARMLLVWDVGAFTYIASAYLLLRRATPADLEYHAARNGEARHFVIGISITGVVASLAIIAFQVRTLAGEPGALQSARAALVLVTVVFSWLLVHVSFATHYAFDYYRTPTGGHGRAEGLSFPGGEEPDFWDFVHFSLVIGLTSATSDINITSKAMRRLTIVHGVCSFLFNTVILAGTVNFAGALFRA